MFLDKANLHVLLQVKQNICEGIIHNDFRSTFICIYLQRDLQVNKRS